MTKVTFITGNQGKANFLAKYLNHPVGHIKLDLDEIQSLDLHEITGHKAKQAYGKIKTPVLVEDVSLGFEALDGLPGPFTKWFEMELGVEGICKMLNNFNTRQAVARICFAYYHGHHVKFFDGEVSGSVPDKPKGNNGFGWNPIFIPFGQTKTYAEMDEDETQKFSLRTTTVYPKIREFLASLDKK